MEIQKILWFLTCVIITLFIFDKTGILKKWKKENEASNKKIAQAKENLRLIDEELKRRKKLKSK